MRLFPNTFCRALSDGGEAEVRGQHDGGKALCYKTFSCQCDSKMSLVFFFLFLDFFPHAQTASRSDGSDGSGLSGLSSSLSCRLRDSQKKKRCDYPVVSEFPFLPSFPSPHHSDDVIFCSAPPPPHKGSGGGAHRCSLSAEMSHKQRFSSL